MILSLNQAIGANSRSRKTANDCIVLRHCKQFKVLVNTTVSLTKASQQYQRLSNSTLETFSYDPQQTPIGTGNQETIQLGGGKERLVRTF